MKKIRYFIIIPIYLYQICISPFLGRNCRFEPTCSQYCKEAILIHGIFLGSILSLKRIIRCNPFGGFGYDPVPKKNKND